MTMGELAKMFNAERNINARLTVVPMEGWQRGDWFDSTGLAWVNPSPNLRSVTEAALYPGVALIEGTNVSVGRGTDTPFELVGAPWINSRELAAYLNARGIAGVRFVPVTFTPTASNYAGQKCEGVNVVLTERNALDAPELGIELAAALQKRQAVLAAQVERLEGLNQEIAGLEAELERLRALQQAREKDRVALDHDMRKLGDDLARSNSRLSVARLELERLRRDADKSAEQRERRTIDCRDAG